MGIITMIKAIKKIHEKDIIFVRIGEFFHIYGKDSFIVAYFLNYKLKEKLKNMNKNRQSTGITLIALVITIIVLLILAGVSIATLSGNNGILTHANDAKIETTLGAVKEAIRLEQVEKKIDGKNINSETLLSEGKVLRTLQQGSDENYYMYYAIKDGAYNGMSGLGKGNIASLKDVFLIDDNLNIKYIANDGKEYGDNINNKILEDETEIRFSSKAFSEYVSKISGVTEENMKFKWMKNQTKLIITDSSVDSLQDLVFFPNLTILQLGDWSNNIPPITSMDGIENCTKLTNISIFFGPDKEYSALKQLSNLVTFTKVAGSDYNNIIDSIKSCQSLRNFTVNAQKNIDMKIIKELKNLQVLKFSSGSIEKIEGLDNLNNLKNLDLSNNKITQIEGLENLPNLKELNLENNDITDIIPLSKNTSLTYLNLRGNTKIDGNRSNYTGEQLEALNKIGEILDRDGEINLNVDKLGLFTNYKKLNLSGQRLTTLEVLEGQKQLISLILGSNNITLEDTKSQEILKNMINLNTLNLNNNKLNNITSINNLINLKNLYMQENNINLKEIEDIISNLNNLVISTESLKTIENCDINKITKLNINGPNELPDLSKFNKLIQLQLNNNPNISNFNNISKLSNLQKLSISENNLHGKMIDFSQLTNLKNLNLTNNTLWSEDLENLKTLKNNTNLVIDLRNNAIIDASALLELDKSCTIYLSGNVNLTQDSKDKLKEKFGNKVTF